MKSSIILLLLGSTLAIRPVEDLDLQLRAALNRGDAFPCVILPGSEPVMPIPSATIELQIDAEAEVRMTVRQQIQQNIREFFASEHQDSQLLQIGDADLTVGEARE